MTRDRRADAFKKLRGYRVNSKLDQNLLIGMFEDPPKKSKKLPSQQHHVSDHVILNDEESFAQPEKYKNLELSATTITEYNTKRLGCAAENVEVL